MFNGRRLSDFFQERVGSLKKEIEDFDDAYVISVNESEVSEYLVSKYRLESIQLDFENISSLKGQEAKVPFHQFGRTYQRSVQRVIVYIPCTSGMHLAVYKPSTGYPTWDIGLGGDSQNGRLTFSLDIPLDGDEIVNAQQFNMTKKSYIEQIKKLSEWSNQDISNYNVNLESIVRNYLNLKIQKVEKKNKLFEMIKLEPIAKKEMLIKLTPARQIELKKPTQKEVKKLEYPMLDLQSYEKIIDTIEKAGQGIERAKSLYQGKDEEALRDLFLFKVQGEFRNVTTTGETFNKSGKTDIVIKYTDNTNVFIAECKIWSGQKAIGEAIEQLFGYLTWQDTRAAIIFFVKSKNISKIGSAIEEGAKKVDANSKRRTSYSISTEIHFPGDSGRIAQVEFFHFHFPE